MSFGALGFLTPLILLALLGLPLLWWLLRATPPVPNQVQFPAFVILRKLTQREETPDRTPWWLLLMRLLLAAFVIIGLAGPVLNAPDRTQNRGPLVIVLDNTHGAANGWSARTAQLERLAASIRGTQRSAFILNTAPAFPVGTQTLLGPMSFEDLQQFAERAEPLPFAADRNEGLSATEALDERLSALSGSGGTVNNQQPEIVWLSDGVASHDSGTDLAFLRALNQRGSLVRYRDETRPQPALSQAPPDPAQPGKLFRIRKLSRGLGFSGSLVAQARDGRELARQPLEIAANDSEAIVPINLPLPLQNDLAQVRLEGVRSSLGVWLADARDRQALIGLLPTEREQNAALLSGNHYVREALNAYASFQTDSIANLVNSNVSMIVLNDVGSMRESDRASLAEWVERGGVLVRFAGPSLADAALDEALPFLPVQLRKGERAFGGALTWATPQPLDQFSPDGPFASLSVPGDVLVRQQVLAEPGGETSERTWASLSDGTPLVTGRAEGNGLIVLFHVTATPLWSDLPLSDTFINMLRRLTFLSSLSPETLDESLTENATTRYSPISVLDGFGQLRTPPSNLSGVQLSETTQPTSPQIPPGLYGSPDTPIAMNAITDSEPFAPLSLSGIETRSYAASPPQYLWVFFFTAALLLLLADMMASLWLGGRLRALRPSAGVSAMMIIAVSLVTFTASTPSANAQTAPLDLPIDQQTIDSTLTTKFAYVKTGDGETDRLTALGLASLSQELSRRTTVSPSAPIAIDLTADDFSIYPILYWPIVPGVQTLPDSVLAEIEDYMRLGGLIIFDTRDDERASIGQETAEAAALRELLSRIDTPPLIQLPTEHVLRRSYYLLPELRGRMGARPVWVAAGSAFNDGVTPLIIGGRDWAGAWARFDNGNAVRPMIANSFNDGPRAREMAFRSGINMAMVAFTGNYKTDQVHATILLERLGEKAP